MAQSGGPTMPLRPAQVQRSQSQPTQRFWKVNARRVSQDANGNDIEDTNGNPTQWTYNVSEVRKLRPGYGGWASKSVTTGFHTTRAYALYEDTNGVSGTGVQPSTGINHDSNYPTGFKMIPLQLGQVYPGFLVHSGVGANPVADPQAIEVWLIGPEGEQGPCT